MVIGVNEMNEQIVAALVAAVVSAIVSLAVALVQMRQNKDSLRSQVQQDIRAKYDKMLDYRLQRPEVLALARRWQPECWEALYTQATEEGKVWVIYYGYVELCIFYCNAVLYAKDKKAIDLAIYESEHEPLIRLLLAEHYPILSAIAQPGGYVSKYLVEHIKTLRQKGWDWEGEYKRLVE